MRTFTDKELLERVAALLAPPSTTMAEVKQEAAKMVTNVSY